jgi:DNA-binding PadR family transcriptional regulator
MKLFDGSVGYFWHASHPQIYKELARLKHNDDVTHRSVEQRGRPTKKIYSLSDSGRRALLAWLRIPARPQRVKDEMMLKTFSSGLLTNEEATELIARHREIHRARLQKYQELERFLRSGPVTSNRLRLGGYLTLLRGIRHASGYIEWCDEAIDLLQRGGEERPRRRARQARTPRT